MNNRICKSKIRKDYKIETIKKHSETITGGVISSRVKSMATANTNVIYHIIK